MRMGFKHLALVLAAGGLALALSGTARADTNSVMTTCSAQYKVDKAAGKVPTGQTWPQYYSACAAAQKPATGSGAATTGTAATGTTATGTAATGTTATGTSTTASTKATGTTSTGAATTATAGAATTTTTATTDTSNGNSTMSTCSAQYKVDKAANKVPAGQTWPQYYSACAATLKASADKAEPTPPEPTAAATAKASTATTDANGKAFTPGQLAAQKRIKECGGMWQADKAAKKLPAGQTWPQYWSACNTKLKAAGN